MKLRAAVGAAVLLMCWTAITCTRQTPGNPSSNQAQSNPSAGNTPPKSAPAPAAAEGNPPANAAAAPQPAPSQAAPAAPPSAPPVAEIPPTPKPEPTPLVLPAGTVLVVTTSSAISAKSAAPGQTFQAVVEQPVVYHGKTAIPAGASAIGTIVAAKQGGKIKGESNLALQLTSVRVHGAMCPIVTSQYVQQQKGKGGRTAKLGAGGAVGGAVIGGIAGGGKGAAIGSIVGGGAGVAGSAMTGNKELAIPAESVLEFRLTQPVRLSSSPAPRPESETRQ